MHPFRLTIPQIRVIGFLRLEWMHSTEPSIDPPAQDPSPKSSDYDVPSLRYPVVLPENSEDCYPASPGGGDIPKSSYVTLTASRIRTHTDDLGIYPTEASSIISSTRASDMQNFDVHDNWEPDRI